MPGSDNGTTLLFDLRKRLAYPCCNEMDNKPGIRPPTHVLFVCVVH